uniref:Uncharacterized protein n=1 Tax=Oryza barthii TaxID=65489 RepID=A0A0D3H587_9ORYZ
MAAASTRRPLRGRATTVDDLDDALLTRNPIVGHYYYPGRGSGGAVFVPSASPSLQPRVDGRR